MKEINLEEILFKKLRQLMEKHPKENYYTDEMIRKSHEYEYFIGAMKDACQQVLELAAESAFASPVYDRDILTDSCVVDKQSILDVINQVK